MNEVQNMRIVASATDGEGKEIRTSCDKAFKGAIVSMGLLMHCLDRRFGRQDDVRFGSPMQSPHEAKTI